MNSDIDGGNGRRMFQPASPAFCALLTSIVFLGGVLPSASGQDSREYKIKAAFLLNFAKFTQWPAGEVPDTSQTFVIGILGGDPFGRDIEEAVRGKTVENRPISIKRFSSLEEIEPCQILFISSSEKGNVARIIETLRAAKTLTVGDREEDLDQGCHISFLLKGNKVKFMVNLKALEDSGFKISSKVLQLAEQVRS